MNKPAKQRVLYVIVCAAGPASHVQDFVTLAQASGWDVYLIPTPNAVPFLDVPLLTELTGYPIRSEARSPEHAGTTPPCDALVIVAGTFNTLNKFALGIADNRALTILCENLGRGRPILVVPCVNQQHLARHPAFFKSLATLREWGVSVLYDLEKYPPRNEVPWPVVLEELERITNDVMNTPQQNDREAVRQAALDYVEGVYEGDISRIQRSVHPELAKRGFFIKQEGNTESIMTFAELIELTRTYKQENPLPHNAPKEIVLFEILDHIASIKITAIWGIDYMHLAKYNDKWVIVHVLWQTHPGEVS